MSIFARLLGIATVDPAAPTAHAVETEKKIAAARGELNQTVQRIESGARVLETWDSAMRLMENRK